MKLLLALLVPYIACAQLIAVNPDTSYHPVYQVVTSATDFIDAGTVQMPNIRLRYPFDSTLARFTRYGDTTKSAMRWQLPAYQLKYANITDTSLYARKDKANTFSLAQTFTTAPVLSSGIASQFVTTDVSKNLTTMNLFEAANTWTDHVTIYGASKYLSIKTATAGNEAKIIFQDTTQAQWAIGTGIQAGSDFTIKNNTSAKVGMRLYNSGDVGIPSGNLTVSGNLVLTTAVEPSAAGQIGYSSVGGSYIWGKAGSTRDFTLYSNGGTVALKIPTGTNNIDVPVNLTVGGATADSNLTVNKGAHVKGGLLVDGIVKTGSDTLSTRTYARSLVVSGGSLSKLILTDTLNASQVVYTTGSGNWTVPATCKRILVRVVGGGGTGGSATGATGGGGAGGYSEGYMNVTPGGTVAYVVGGVSGTSSVSNGTLTIRATGGATGPSGGPTMESGGVGGVGSGGALNMNGSDGGCGWYSSGYSLRMNGCGGNSVFGGGGVGLESVGGANVGATSAKANSGSGGGGGGTAGTGASGIVIINY